MQIWCSHYETRCLFVAADGPAVLFDYANHPHLAEGLPTVDDYRVMTGFYYFTAGPRAEERSLLFADQIADLMAKHGGGNRRLAVDQLSHLGVDAIRAQGIEVVNGEEVAEQARAIKSPEELALMRASIAVCEAAMTDMRAALEPGITENALWAKLHETNIRLGGEWIETQAVVLRAAHQPLVPRMFHAPDRGGRPGQLRHRSDRPLRLLRRHLPRLGLRRQTER